MNEDQAQFENKESNKNTSSQVLVMTSQDL